MTEKNRLLLRKTKTFLSIMSFAFFVITIIAMAGYFGASLKMDIEEKSYSDSLKIENLKLENELLKLKLEK
jgi:hypothetical protein